MDTLHPQLVSDMKAKGIDIDLSLAILQDYNAGKFDGMKPVRATGLPAVDGHSVIDAGPESRATLRYSIPADEAGARLARFGIEVPASCRRLGDRLVFDSAALGSIGRRLLADTAFGVLNGGSATSYADSKKNAGFGQAVSKALQPGFDVLAPLCVGRSKGLTPAWLNPDGSPGLSFLVLKMRSRLLAARRWEAEFGPFHARHDFMPLFQMTSILNDAEIQTAYQKLAGDESLAVLAESTGLEAASWLGAVQPMISAYSHSAEGRPKRIFDRAGGAQNCALALPGGHGQNFLILRDVYRRLRDSGVHFAYIGNVDNTGYLPDPFALALLALSGKPAAFEFSLRTPVDVKGGILVETAEGGRTIADIGPAIAWDRVLELESGGKSVLFNCATGLFDLDWLVPHLDEVAARLPMRFTDQDKDAGRYSQAEQVTWEIAGILPDFLALVVRKEERFIAAKLLAETLINSGYARDSLPADLAAASDRIHSGLTAILRETCGLELRDGRWVPGELSVI